MSLKASIKALKKFEKKYHPILIDTKSNRKKNLVSGFKLLFENPVKQHKLHVRGQLFDSELLYLSPVYLRSRNLYLKGNGQFIPSYITAFRTYHTVDLIYPRIAYNPVSEEIAWQYKNYKYVWETDLPELVDKSVNIFHEQNHRILWSLLPAPPKQESAFRRYLHFTESLIVALDVALADQLDKKAGFFFCQTGVTYQLAIGREASKQSKKYYKEFLLALSYSAFLFLCFYPKNEALKVIQILFPTLEKDVCKNIVKNMYGINTEFSDDTNMRWQQMNGKEACQVLSKGKDKVLNISDNPLDYAELRILSELWLDKMVFNKV